MMNPTPSKFTLCKLKSCSCLKYKSQLSGEQILPTVLHGNEGNYFVRKPQKHRRLQLFSSCLYAINTKKILKIAAFLFRFLLIFAEWLNSYLARVQIPISHFLWAKLKKICGFWKSYGNKLAEIKTKKCHYQSLLIKILRTVTCIHHKDFSEIFR